MLAVFEKSVGSPPAELSFPGGSRRSKTREEIAAAFNSSWPDATFCNFSNGSFMALSHQDETPYQPRSIVAMDDLFCIFEGNVQNMCELKRHYGLSRNATEGLLVLEVYKVMRDRAPYPADQMIRDFLGPFAFILFDTKSATLFVARDRDGRVKLNWGVAGDGSLVLSNDPKTVWEACGRSSGPFPQGCIFLNSGGLISFVHPTHRVRAIRREEEGEGPMGSCVMFQVDLFTRIPSIQRVGSDANWANTTMV